MKNHTTIELHQHGVLICDPIPVDQLSAVSKMAKALGYDLIDPGISSALDVTFAIVSEESGEMWRADIDEDAQRRHGHSKAQAWRHSTDVGVSACTIAHVMFGTSLLSGRADVPHDADDFGRCRRLCEAFGLTQEDLWRVAEIDERWTPIIEQWDTLTQLYDWEKFDAVYEILKEVR